MANRTFGAARAVKIPAIVLAVDLHHREHPIEAELAEFEALIDAAGGRVAERIVQKRDRVDAAYLTGSGKATEVAERIKELNAQILFVLNDLRPRQRRNLAKIIEVPIVDRTMLILDVFAQHARTREGKLQVELAQLRFRQSNLIGIGTELSRLGGGIGTRGPGETKLETDRRKIALRIKVLSNSLEDVRRSRATRRAGDRNEPLVALVGYTNVGKSSLLNRLARSNALVADQPFATLDPTMRKVYLGPKNYIRVVDTVGFISELPEELITAFRATLEELEDADLLLHLLDASNPDWPRQQASVDAILDELGLHTKSRLIVFNKCDVAASEPADAASSLCVSAKTGAGIDALRGELAQRFQS